MSGSAGLQSDRYLGTGFHTRKSPGPWHMASTHLQHPCTHHLSGCRRALHVPYAVPEHPGLGSLDTCRLPSSSGLWVDGGGTAKSQVSPVEMRLPPATQGPGPGPGPSPSSASASHAGLVSQKQTSRLPLPLPPTPASFRPVTPLQRPHGLLAYFLALPLLSLLCPSFPSRLPSKAPAHCRVREPDLGPA